MNTIIGSTVLALSILGPAVPAATSEEDGAGPEAGSPGLSAGELAIWNDPRFQRRFLESYIAETETEPRITSNERDDMEDILDYIASDEVEKAVRLLNKRRGEAASAVFDFTRANIHFQQDELEEARDVYRIAVDKYPRFLRAWRNLGLIHVRMGDFEPAVDAFTQVLQLGGNDALTYGLLGFSYANIENHLSSETAYRMAVLLDPKTADWKMGLARSLFKQERFADAVALTASMLAREPGRSDLWLLQANAYIGLGQPARAAENYELVDQLGRSTPDSLNMLGDIYINEELYDMAVDAYVRSMEMAPEKGASRPLRAAKVLTSRGALDVTKRLVDRLDEIHGDGMEPEERKDMLKLRALLAVDRGASDEEAAILEEIVALDPLDGEALILLGQHSQRAGDMEKAIFYFERAAGLEAYEADAKVRHAQLLVSQGKYNLALPLLRRAQLLKPRDNIQEYLEQVERVSSSR